MTIKEIAEAVGKTDRAVRNWANKVAEKDSSMSELISVSTSTHPADFGKNETMAIIEKGMGKNAAYMYRQNADSAPMSYQPHTDIDKNETMAIIEKGMGKNTAYMYRQNADSAPMSYQPHTDIDKLVALVETLVNTVTKMSYQSATNRQPIGNQLLLSEEPITAMTLTGYSRVNNLSLSEGDKRTAGMVLRGICNQRGLTIKPIPDAHYGRVNTYPIELLDEYYTP